VEIRFSRHAKRRIQLNFNVMPEVLNRASRAFLDSPVKPENDKNVSLLIAVLV